MRSAGQRGYEMAYPADSAQDDLRLPDEREDVERPSSRLAGSVSATAVHRATVRVGRFSLLADGGSLI